MRKYAVKLTNYSPMMIFAESKWHAAQLALERNPYCWCGCGESSKIEWSRLWRKTDIDPDEIPF